MENKNDKYTHGNIAISKLMGHTYEDEFFITEWTSDHANTNWWKRSEIMSEFSICRDSENINEWHCQTHAFRTYTEPYNKSWDVIRPVIDTVLNYDLSVFNYDVTTMTKARQIKMILKEMKITANIDDVWKLVADFSSMVEKRKHIDQHMKSTVLA